MQIVSLKYDYCFKECLSNETIRRYFISDVLDIPVEEIRTVRYMNCWDKRNRKNIILYTDCVTRMEMNFRMFSRYIQLNCVKN